MIPTELRNLNRCERLAWEAEMAWFSIIDQLCEASSRPPASRFQSEEIQAEFKHIQNLLELVDDIVSQMAKEVPPEVSTSSE